jgi:tetratricopeptide (TPR) repeat protein
VASSLLIPPLIVIQMNALRLATNAQQVDRSVQMLKWVGRETTELHVRLGDRFAAVDNRPRAIRHYRRSIELFPTGRAWAGLGLQHRALGDWQATLTAFDAAIELTPTLFAAEFHRAEALLAIDAAASADVSSAEAIASLERMLEIDPGHVAAASWLARLQAEHGQLDQAVDTLEAALESALEVVAPRDRQAIRVQLERLRR